MWRVPLKKIYRAFPELDQFSDVQCERYVAFAKGDIGCAFYFVPPLTAAAAFVVCICVYLAVGRRLGFGSPNTTAGILFQVVATVTFLFGLPLVGGFLARDALLGLLLRRHVRSRVERTRCPGCRYSLLGQRMVNGVIGCPECGGTTTLEALGLNSEEDLIPPRNHDEASALERLS